MFIFGIRAVNRQYRDILDKFNYLHSLLTVDDKKRVDRLEFISQTNLLYNDIFSTYNKRLIDLLDNKDKVLNSKINEIKILIEKKDYTNAKSKLNEIKDEFNNYDIEVNQLNTDLIKVLAPEEDCKKEIANLNENFNLVKQEYQSHIDDLLFLKNTYETVFKHIDKLLKDVSTYIEDANYDEVKSTIPEIKEMLNELDQINLVMPELSILANKILPQKIGDLKIEYRRIQMDNCPIFNIFSDHTISDMEEELNKIVHELKLFIYKDKKDRLNNLLNLINEKVNLFNKERNDKKEFEQLINNIYLSVRDIEKKFIRLSNSLPKIKAIYKINEDKLSTLNTIKKHIDNLGLLKRGLERLIHSNIAQPYSLLLEKCKNLDKEKDEVIKDLNDFNSYLSSLKNDVERAYTSISNYFYKVKEKEKLLRDIGMDLISDKYKDKIEEIYKNLNEIKVLSEQTPIDVEEINNRMNFINYDGESTLNQIEQDFNMMKMAEQAIVFSNNNRENSPNLNVLIEQDEKMFFDGEFEKAYTDASKNIKNYNENDNDKKKRK